MVHDFQNSSSVNNNYQQVISYYTIQVCGLLKKNHSDLSNFRASLIFVYDSSIVVLRKAKAPTWKVHTVHSIVDTLHPQFGKFITIQISSTCGNCQFRLERDGCVETGNTNRKKVRCAPLQRPGLMREWAKHPQQPPGPGPPFYPFKIQHSYSLCFLSQLGSRSNYCDYYCTFL